MKLKGLACLLLMGIACCLCVHISGENKTRRYINIARHNEDISIMVNFGKSSATQRFVVYDNKKHHIVSSSKCAHGSGGGSTVDKPVFSNKIGSNCSSLGEFKLLGISRLNNYNLPCIRIKGLSKTNSNAYKRGIVIHEAPFVTSPSTVGIKIPISPYISQGCFSISSDTFDILCDLIKEGKTIYLYSTYSPNNKDL